MAAQYIITNGDETSYISMSGRVATWTVSHKFASVFLSADKAAKLAEKMGGKVVPHYGFTPRSTKSTVAPVQNKINRRTPYRSC